MKIAKVKCKKCGTILDDDPSHEYIKCTCGAIGFGGSNIGGNCHLMDALGDKKLEREINVIADHDDSVNANALALIDGLITEDEFRIKQRELYKKFKERI